jgi:hypothetical protein
MREVAGAVPYDHERFSLVIGDLITQFEEKGQVGAATRRIGGDSI